MNLQEAITILKEETNTAYGLEANVRAERIFNINNTIRLIKNRDVNPVTLKSFGYFCDYADEAEYVLEQVDEPPYSWIRTVRAYNLVRDIIMANICEYLKEIR